MRKFIWLICFVTFFPSLGFSLTYDPATNSYINENAVEEVSTNNGSDELGGTVVEEEEDTTTSESISNTLSEEEINPNQVSSVGNSSNEEAAALLAKQDRDGPLEYLHSLLNDYIATLHEQLDDNYDLLLDEAKDLLGDTNNSRLETLQCLGVIDSDFDSLNNVTDTYTKLKNDIDIVTADLHSEISALEIKIDQELLSGLDENLEIASVQNKVDAYNSEYANLIDMFYELSRDEVKDVDVLIDEGSSDYKLVVDQYDERVLVYEAMEEEYEEFLEKSSFAGVLAGPNMQSLVETLDEVKRYYSVAFINQWKNDVATHIPASETEFIAEMLGQSLNAFSNQFSTTSDGLLNGLYPVQELQTIHESVLTVRSAYLQANGAYDCQAFASNKTIDLAVPQLIKEMDNTLTALNKAANDVASDSGSIPLNLEELKEGLIKALDEQGDSVNDLLLQQEKIRIRAVANTQGVSWLSIAITPEQLKWEVFIRGRLAGKYYDYLEADRVSSFVRVLEGAHQKIENTFEIKNPTGKTRLMLETIKGVIEEFIK